MGSPLNEYHDFIDAMRRIDEDENMQEVDDVLNPEDQEEVPAEEEAAPEKEEEAPAEEPEEPAEEPEVQPEAPAEDAPVDEAPEAVVEEGIDEAKCTKCKCPKPCICDKTKAKTHTGVKEGEEDRSDFPSSSGQDAGDEVMVQKGKEIAELLNLSTDGEGQYNTTYGSKSAKGLYLTLKGMFEEEAAPVEEVSDEPAVKAHKEGQA